MVASPSASPHDGPVVRVTTTREGRPLRAAARGRIERPAKRVWDTIYDVESFARFLPMVSHVRARENSATFDLKFRIGFFSTGFSFTAKRSFDEGKRLAYAWTSGEPRAIELVFTVTPLEGDLACMVETEAAFEVESLGWLVKYFLKHHPEIQHGIFPGITLVLLDSIRRATSA